MRSSMVPDDDEAELIEQKEKEAIERGETLGTKGGKKAAQKRTSKLPSPI
jgi:DNA helicase INO80